MPREEVLQDQEIVLEMGKKKNYATGGEAVTSCAFLSPTGQRRDASLV